MAQTVEIAPNLRKIYKRFFGFLGINNFVHAVVNFVVDRWAASQNFSFPKKFNWEWKMEMLSKKYESETLHLFEHIIKPGMQVVDIGAHIGFFSRIFSELTGNSGRVYCFEADPENFSLLKKNTSHLSNVSLFQKAVSDKNGTMDFYHLDNSTGCHSVVDDGSPSTKITVDAITLDTMIENGEIEKIDIIKIDIEGGEPFAFRGMEKFLRSDKNIKLIAEFNQSSLMAGNTSPRDFIDQIKSYGFEIFFITDKGLISFDTIKESDQSSYFLPTGYVNLFCKK